MERSRLPDHSDGRGSGESLPLSSRSPMSRPMNCAGERQSATVCWLRRVQRWSHPTRIEIVARFVDLFGDEEAGLVGGALGEQ